MTLRRKILVIGSGGREHALALRLLESASVGEVLVSPGNAGTRSAPPWLSGKVLRNIEQSSVAAAKAERPDLVVVGPEAPLAAGLVDRLTELKIPTFGPTARAARLESSKSFMKDFAVRHGIPTARYVTVSELSELDAALASFDEPPVVKADGLCAGKGVFVAHSHEEARSVARDMLSGKSFGEAGETVVLEQRIEGREVSVHVISDGERFFSLPIAQDHKRIGDGDTGPNTGGMGAYAPATLVDDEQQRWIEEKIIAPALRGMAQEGAPFRGTLYAGLMLPQAGDPIVIEFNVRFGDPEAQVIFNVLDGDLADALLGASTGALDAGSLTTSARHALCVVLASGGYPGSPELGQLIEGLDRAEQMEGVRVYHAGTRAEAGRVLTAGGRVLGITAQGGSFTEARARAYEAAAQIRFSGMQFRRDIGQAALAGAHLDRKGRQR